VVSGHCLSFRATRVHPRFLWLRVSQSLVFWVVFWIYCLSFCHFSVGSLHCLSFDFLWLPLWCFENFLIHGDSNTFNLEKKISQHESKIVQNFTSEHSRFTININATIQDLSPIRGRRGRNRMVVGFICNQCLSSLALWVRIPLMTRCTRNNIMW
jgi:hypothetical protein